MSRSIRSSLLSAAVLLAGILPAQTPSRVDFRNDIRPLFQENCIGCHGPVQQKGGMRLDQRSSAMAIRGGTIIGPGNAAGSMLYQKLIGNRYGDRMPPTGALSQEQISLVKSWIDQGADWPDELAGEKPATIADPRAAGIMEALRVGDKPAFARLLRADPEAAKLKGAGGSTPLMYAALYGDAASVRQLMELGADPNTSNDAGATALMWAVDDLEKTGVLLERGADANAVSNDNRSPLAIAVSIRGSAPVVSCCSIAARRSMGKGTLARACSPAQAAMKRFCARFSSMAPHAPASGFASALSSDCAACVDLVIPSIPKAALSSALITRAGDRDARAFRILLDHEADAKAATPGLGFTSLMYAADAEAGARIG